VSVTKKPEPRLSRDFRQTTAGLARRTVSSMDSSGRGEAGLAESGAATVPVKVEATDQDQRENGRT